MWARTIFSPAKYDPFKRHDLSGAFGGPIVKNRTFFFASVQPLWSLVTRASSLSTFESPEFVNWARQRFPNTIGTKLLTERPPVNVWINRVSRTGRDIFGADCDTPATFGLPCSMPMVMEGGYRSSLFRNGLQYSFRGDQYLNGNRERIYGSFYKMDLDFAELAVRRGYDIDSSRRSHGVQANWTHTFSPVLLNEFSFSYVTSGNPSFKKLPWDPSATEEIPNIGISFQSIGLSPPSPGSWAQDNYDWRNTVSYVRGAHSFKFGFEAWRGDDDAEFVKGGGHPSFSFFNLLDFVRDKPYQQTGPLYNPLTGQPGRNEYRHLLNTFGAFIQDNWKVRPNLTLTLGVRWDDYGNIHRDKSKTVNFGTIKLGPGNTTDERFASASVRSVDFVYNGRLNKNFSPRIGFAWDPRRNATWSVRGGMGLYRDWIPLGEANNLRSNPPNLISGTFRVGEGIEPVYSLGTSRTFPYGFKLPALPTRQLDERGGLVGARANSGGIDPDIHAPYTLIYNIGFERRLSGKMVGGAMYSGSRTWGANIATDFNRFPGDLLDGILNRLNPSFGAMNWDYNANNIRYNAMILTLRQTATRSTSLQASYSLSKVTDYGQYGARNDQGDRPGAHARVPSQHNLKQYEGPADWDVRHAFSLAALWQLPSPATGANPFLKRLLGGWELTTVAVLQSGRPFQVANYSAFNPIRDAQGKVIGYRPGSGDYNADGFNSDYPNVPSTDFTGKHSRQDFIRGLFTAADFPAPEPGKEGTLKRTMYRGPGTINVDAGLIKNNALPLLGERGALQLRFDFFNVLNRTNLRQVDGSLTSATFGRSTSTYGARNVIVGARIIF